MATTLLTTIKAYGVCGLQLSQGFTEIGKRDLIMIGHQALYMHYQAKRLTGLRQDFQKPDAICIITKHGLLLITSGHDVIYGIFIFYTRIGRAVRQ